MARVVSGWTIESLAHRKRTQFPEPLGLTQAPSDFPHRSSLGERCAALLSSIESGCWQTVVRLRPKARGPDSQSRCPSSDQSTIRTRPEQNSQTQMDTQETSCQPFRICRRGLVHLKLIQRACWLRNRLVHESSGVYLGARGGATTSICGGKWCLAPTLADRTGRVDGSDSRAPVQERDSSDLIFCRCPNC